MPGRFVIPLCLALACSSPAPAPATPPAVAAEKLVVGKAVENRSATARHIVIGSTPEPRWS